MTRLMERAIEAVRGLSPDAQDELARVMLQLTGEEQAIIELSPEEHASFDESFAQAERGEFASDEEIRALLGQPKP
jgi:hypothetical protein